jgi:hypothetical protein
LLLSVAQILQKKDELIYNWKLSSSGCTLAADTRLNIVLMRLLLPCLAALPIAVAAAEPPIPTMREVLETRSYWLSDSVVEQAVLATLAELRPAAASGKPEVLGATAAAKFARDVDYARLPGCLRTDGLKFQPTQLGPFTVHGIRAGFPFMVIAKLRGKCN